MSTLTGHTSPAESESAAVLVVDDHELARAGLVSMLVGESDFHVVGEADNGETAVGLCALLHPSLVLMDVRMPGMDGLTATAAIKAQSPTTSVLIVTLYEEQDYLLQAIKAGAAGYILKDASRKEMLATIRRILGGDVAMDPALASRLLRRLSREQRPAWSPLEEPLTPRQLEVLRLLVEGQTNQEIANDLGIGPGTVKSHVEHIIAKLGATDRTQAAVRAVQRGLVVPLPADF